MGSCGVGSSGVSFLQERTVSAISAAEGKGGGYTALVAVNNGTLENVITYVTVNYVATSYTTPDHGGIAGLIGCAKGEKG